MNDNKIGVTWYFCPTRLTGTYCYDGGDKIIVNINSRRYEADGIAELISKAASMEIAWWPLRYNLWLMVRPEGGDWVKCAIRVWNQYWTDDHKSCFEINITDAKDNSLLVAADFQLPYEFASQFARDLDDIAYNVCDPGPLAEENEWVKEYCKSSRLSMDVLLARSSDNHYVLTR